MSEKDLRDELLTLLTDGPTSSSLAWVFKRLLRHPEKLARLREEVLAGEDGSYMDAVVKETLRLCPPVAVVVRRLLKPMELGGHMLPPGTTVAPCIYLIHRREDVYPHPRSFVPERFLKRRTGHRTWIPFGGGVRRCLAASYAEMEMEAGCCARCSARSSCARSSPLRARHRSAIAFGPDRHGLVVAEPVAS